MKEIKTWKVLLAIVLLVGFFSIKGCSEKKTVHNGYKAFEKYQHLVKEYVAKDGTVVNYNTALETDMVTLRNANDSLANYIDNLDVKKVKTITLYDTHFELDTVYIPFDKPIEDVKFIRAFEVDSTGFYMSGEVTELGMSVDSIGISNRVGITTSYKKAGLFKKELIVTVTNSNELVKVDGISTFVIEDKKQWWKKGGLKVIAGAIVGGIVTYKIVK